MTTRSFRKGAVLTISLFSILACIGGCGKGDQSDSATVAGAASDSAMSMKESARNADSMQSAKSPAVNTTNGVGATGQLLSASTGTVPIGQLASAKFDNGAVARQAAEGVARKVIRNADLDIRVGNVEKAEKAVSSIVQAAGGYTENASSTDLASNHPVMNISLRVPVDAFDTTISKFEALGVRLSKKIGSEDVTGRIVDLDAQLKMLKIQEEVYRNMLKGRTQLEEVFNIQQQLTSVQTQIEDITAQRKTQSGLASLSTISLVLEQDAVVSQTPTDPNWLVQSWAGATSSASSALRFVAVFLMWAVAFCPFWIPVAIILRRVARGGMKAREGLVAREGL